MTHHPRCAPPAALTLVFLLFLPAAARAESTDVDEDPAPAKVAETLHGRVLDPSGAPVAGATIRAQRSSLSMADRDRHVDDWTDPAVGLSGDDGEFRIADLKPDGPFTLRIEPPLHAPQTLREVRAGERLEIRVEPGRTIQGRVAGFAGQEPVEAATVIACDVDAWIFGAQACRDGTTNREGRFTIAGLPAIALQVRATAPRHAMSAVKRLRPAAGDDPVEVELLLRAGARIAGRVVDQRDRPVAGARVLVVKLDRSPADRRSSAWSAWPVFSGDDGGFAVEGVESGGSFELRVRRSDRPAAVEGPLSVKPGADVDDMEIVLPAGAALTMRIEDEDGEPVPGVELFVAPAGGTFGPLTKSLPPERVKLVQAGRFRVEPMREGRIDLLLVPEGYAEIRRNGVRLTGGETTDLGKLVAERGRRVEGRVTTPEQEPIAEAFIQAWDGGPMSVVSRRTTTDVDGRYSVAGLREGTATLYVEAEGYRSTNREITPDEDIVDVVLDPTGAITGSVRLEDGQVPPVFTLFVYAEIGEAGSQAKPDPTARQSFSGGDGTYRVSDVAEGTYSIEARAPGWTPGRASGVEVAAGVPTAVEPITLGRGKTLRGRVLSREDDSPVAGASVEAISRQGRALAVTEGIVDAAAGCDEHGGFELTGLVPGPYTLRARHPSFAGAEIEVVVGEDRATEEPTLRLTRGGTLTGTVRASGSPVMGRHVTLGDPVTASDSRVATTDADGVYVFERVAEGSYPAQLLPASGDDLRIVTRTATVREGQVTVLDFETDAGIHVHGLVLRGGEPVSGAALYFDHHDGTSNPAEMQVAESADGGRYDIGLDAPGRYRVMVQAGTAGSSTTEILVPDQPDVLRDIVLDADSEGISGTVLDIDGNPLTGAAVSARRDGSSTGSAGGLLIAETDADGRYAIRGLEAGLYRVTAVAPGFQTGVVFPVEITQQAPSGSADFLLTPGRSIRGRVIDPRGGGISGALVLCAAEGQADPLNAASAQTDINGAFRITVPGEGLLDVTAIANDWAPVTLTGIVAPEPADPAELVLQTGSGGSLRVRVVDAEGNPRAGERLVIRPSVPFVGSELYELLNPPGATDARGEILFEHLAARLYRVSIPGRNDVPPADVAVQDHVETPATIRIP